MARWRPSLLAELDRIDARLRQMSLKLRDTSRSSDRIMLMAQVDYWLDERNRVTNR
jgi:hypothetical protein